VLDKDRDAPEGEALDVYDLSGKLLYGAGNRDAAVVVGEFGGNQGSGST